MSTRLSCATADRGPRWGALGRVLPLTAVSAALSLGGMPAAAHDAPADARPPALRDVAFDQRLNEPVPLDAAFRDAAGRAVRLGEYFGARPVVLVPVYYRCQHLCPLVLDGLVRALRPLRFSAGQEFAVVVVSFDPQETPALAAARRADVLRRYGRPETEAGWHFLTGEETSVRRLTQALGFRYARGPGEDRYGHAAGIVLATPAGRIARYFYGIEFSPRDMRLGFIEAAENRIGSPLDQVLLISYRYDPATGRYGVVVMNVVRLAGLATGLALGVFLLVMFRRERRRTGPAPPVSP